MVFFIIDWKYRNWSLITIFKIYRSCSQRYTRFPFVLLLFYLELVPWCRFVCWCRIRTTSDGTVSITSKYIIIGYNIGAPCIRRYLRIVRGRRKNSWRTTKKPSNCFKLVKLNVKLCKNERDKNKVK